MGENMADNFKFVKSETDIFVQLSDVVAGILGKLFKYINSTSVNSVEEMLKVYQSFRLKIFY